MYKKLLSIAVLLSMVVFISSCGDDDEETKIDAASFVGNWRMKSAIIKNPATVNFSAIVSATPGTPQAVIDASRAVTDLYGFIGLASACTLDNIFKFQANGTVAENTGPSACAGQTAANTDIPAASAHLTILLTGSQSNFVYNAERRTLQFSKTNPVDAAQTLRAEWDVISVNASEMKVSLQYAIAGANPGTFTVEVTFEKVPQ